MSDYSGLCMGCLRQKGQEPVCQHCGFDNSKQNKNGFLPLKSVLKDRYLIGRLLRINGEGITYLGYDTSFEKAVWVREFAPAALCQRDKNGNSILPFPNSSEQYKQLLADFIVLNKALAKLPSISAVMPTVDMFSQNETFYSVSDAFDGITFKEFMKRAGHELAWADVKRFFVPILNSLNTLSNESIFHLGISPETIYINRHGELKLTDFCIRDLRLAEGILKTELYPGYAPLEQYDLSAMIGPWSDIYAVSAVMYTALTQTTPPTIKQRTQNQRLSYASELNHGVPQSISVALQNALSFSPQERIQSFSEYIKILNREEPVPDSISKRKTASTMSKSDMNTQKPKKPKQKSYAGLITLTSIVIFTAIGIIIFTTLFEDQIKVSLYGSSVNASSVSSADTTSAGTSSPVAYGTLENFVGLPYDVVKDELDAMPVTVTMKAVYSEDYSEGVICEQEPVAYTSLDQVTSLTVKVSKGQEFVLMPEVEGKTIEQVRQSLYDLQIKYEEIPIYDTRYPNSYVVRADRNVNEKVYIKQDNITIFVSGYTASSES